MRKFLSSTAIALIVGHLVFTAPVHAQGWPVFDAQNYVQNLLTAVRELQQIENQIRSLQNEATMIKNMERNLQPMSYSAQGQLENTLRQIISLMNRAQGIQYEVNTTEAQFARMYPREYATTVNNDELAQQARQRWSSSMDTLQETMAVQSQVVGNVQG